MKPLTFSYEGLRFEVGVNALVVMRSFVQDESEKPESGGVLIGRYLLGSSDIVVDELTTPMKSDKQTRYSYFRAQKRHQQVIDKCWHASNGTCNYLGEWHTHPEPSPTPSPRDLRNWRKKLKGDIYDNDSLYFVIVGQQKIKAWRGCKRTLAIAQLTLEGERNVWQNQKDADQR